MNKTYTEVNSECFDKWVAEGWMWGQPISHEIYADRYLSGHEWIRRAA